MTALEKYPQLQDKAFLKKMVVNSVYGSMALEEQTVPRATIAAYVEVLISKLEWAEKQPIEKA